MAQCCSGIHSSQPALISRRFDGGQNLETWSLLFDLVSASRKKGNFKLGCIHWQAARVDGADIILVPLAAPTALPAFLGLVTVSTKNLKKCSKEPPLVPIMKWSQGEIPGMVSLS